MKSTHSIRRRARKLGHINGDPRANDKGLFIDEIKSVAKHFGVNAIELIFSQNPGVDYDHYLYSFIESRCPIILGVQGWHYRNNNIVSHVMTIMGHTMNSDRWAPKAHKMYGGFPITDYINAASYIDHFIINDDNYGIFSTLSVESLRSLIVPAKNPNLHASMAIVFVPDKVVLPGYDAEQIAVKSFIEYFVLGKIQLLPKWHARIDSAIKKTGDIVARTILQKREYYIDYVEKNLNAPGTQLPPVVKNLLNGYPELIWITEISLPDIYTGNKHKLADVIVDATSFDKYNPKIVDILFPLHRGHVDLIRNPGEPNTTDW